MQNGLTCLPVQSIERRELGQHALLVMPVIYQATKNFGSEPFATQTVIHHGMPDRCLRIDHAKGLGILLVVYGHVARGVAAAAISSAGYNHELVDQILYSFHMPLFFFLSGLVFIESVRKYGRMGVAFRKIDALLYPYIVWSLLQGSIEVQLSRFTNHSISFADVYTHLLVPRAQFWFLYALYFVSITAALLYRARRTSATSLVLLAAFIAFMAQDWCAGVPPIQYVAQYLVYFAFGVSFNQFLNVGAQRYSGAFLYAGICGFLLAQILARVWPAETSGSLIESRMASFCTAIVSILFMAAVSMSVPRQWSKWLAYLGECSMAIFLMHILAGSGTRVLLQKILGIQSLGVHLIVGTAAGILLPILGLKLISKWHLSFLLRPIGPFRIGHRMAVAMAPQSLPISPSY